MGFSSIDNLSLVPLLASQPSNPPHPTRTIVCIQDAWVPSDGNGGTPGVGVLMFRILRGGGLQNWLKDQCESVRLLSQVKWVGVTLGVIRKSNCIILHITNSLIAFCGSRYPPQSSRIPQKPQKPTFRNAVMGSGRRVSGDRVVLPADFDPLPSAGGRENRCGFSEGSHPRADGWAAAAVFLLELLRFLAEHQAWRWGLGHLSNLGGSMRKTRNVRLAVLLLSLSVLLAPLGCQG